MFHVEHSGFRAPAHSNVLMYQRVTCVYPVDKSKNPLYINHLAPARAGHSFYTSLLYWRASVGAGRVVLKQQILLFENNKYIFKKPCYYPPLHGKISNEGCVQIFRRPPYN